MESYHCLAIEILPSTRKPGSSGGGPRVNHTGTVPGHSPDYPDELAQIVAELNRAAHPDSSPKPRATTSAPAGFASTNPSSLDQLLALAVRRAASDLLLIAGAPVT